MSTCPGWRFINSGPCRASFNMALDEAILRSVEEGNSPPTLRVYSWRDPAVSLGYNGKGHRELDLECCRKAGIQVVRRPTGGRAVYHANELTYSVAGPGNTDWLGRSTGESYRIIARAIKISLALLGAELDVASSAVKSDGWKRQYLKTPCFNSVSRYEITHGGRKLVGSAQRRLGESRAFLEQGSLLLKNEQSLLAELMPESLTPEERSRLRNYLSQHAVGLEEIVGRQVAFDEVAECFYQGFGKAFGCEFTVSGPTDEEKALAGRLEEEIYSTLSGCRKNSFLLNSEF
jgi:lipoate-protein ligase A